MTSGISPLEQFVVQAKTAKGLAAVNLIIHVLESSNMYVFGELLDMPNIQELEHNEQSEPYFRLLNLFAYGTYSDYKANRSKLPELSPTMLSKLKHLTIVSLATKQKCIPYSVLLKELDLQNLRALEDLIIEVIYADIVRGKLDQKNQQLEIDYAIGRDIRPEAVSEIISVLEEWCSSSDAVLQGIEAQISKANSQKENHMKIKSQIEIEVANIKKTLKSTQKSDMDEQMVTDSRDVPLHSDKPVKKSTKMKGLRGSNVSKPWK